MWIVKLALRRPYTFVVVSLLIAVLGPVSVLPTKVQRPPSRRQTNRATLGGMS